MRKFKVQNMVLNDENSWDGILTSTMFTLRTTIHTTTQHTPTQLVFGQDSKLNTSHEANYKSIKERKKDLVNKTNQRENCN